MSSLSLGSNITIQPPWKAQIALLLTKKVNIPAKYADFITIFLKKFGKELPEQTSINEYIIKLKKDKQPPYKPIYSLELVKFKTFKIYIEINLANSFIQLLNPPITAPIIFIYKLNDSLCLYVNYQGLNNLIIKN